MKLLLYVGLLAAAGQADGRLIGGYGEELERPQACAGPTCPLYAAQRLLLPEKAFERLQFLPRVAKKQSLEPEESFVPWKPLCGCPTQHELVNLGEGHYPRYITTARCKAKSTPGRFHQCKYYDYRVHVLVKRGMDSILKNADDIDEIDFRDIEELTLPESLQANWQLFAISVSVACVAAER